MTLAIKLKSLKDSAENSDGLRILISRYLPKDKENWDQWWKELAPSRDLWKSYIKDKKIGWPEYERQYIDEIKNNPESVNLLQIVSSFVNGNGDGSKYVQQEQEQQKRYDLIQKCDTLTLLCHCKDEKYCHRSIVKEMILKSSWNI